MLQELRRDSRERFRGRGREEENVCVVCLGSMSSSKEVDGLVELFREKFEKYSEVKDFQLNVSMPRNCGIRAAMIRHELAMTFSRDYSSLDPSPDSKTCLKSVLVSRLERVLKLSHCSNSEMQLSLDMSHETSDGDATFVSAANVQEEKINASVKEETTM